jgi:hypothetical protein
MARMKNTQLPSAVQRTIRLIRLIRLILCVASLGCALPATAADAATAHTTADITPFSKMTAGGPIIGWQALRIAPKAKNTQFDLVNDNGQTVLRAEANNSMSAMSFPLQVDVNQYPRLRWRWKISSPVKSANMMKKSGDDYAARMYVMFDLPADKLPFALRAKLRFGENFYHQKIPNAILSFVWDNKHPIGTRQPNIYSDLVNMVVLESGTQKVGQWVIETVDLAASFKQAFGMNAPRIVAIALASDTDNTGENVTAWYGDVEFLHAANVSAPDAH